MPLAKIAVFHFRAMWETSPTLLNSAEFVQRRCSQQNAHGHRPKLVRTEAAIVEVRAGHGRGQRKIVDASRAGAPRRIQRGASTCGTSIMVLDANLERRRTISTTSPNEPQIQDHMETTTKVHRHTDETRCALRKTLYSQ